jgi:hypothetical protein
MLVVILLGLVVISLILIDILVHLPLDILGWIQPSSWLVMILFVVLVWCFGND